MLYFLLYSLHNQYSFFNVFRYITFRAILAVLTAVVISFFCGPAVIRKLKQLQVKQYIREDGPSTHLGKEGTPTMGGTLILSSIVISVALWADLTNFYIRVILLVTLGFGAIGFADDYLKLTRKNSKGLGGKEKMLFQILVALAASLLLYRYSMFNSTFSVPFFKGFMPNLGAYFILLAVLVIVGTSNAVNLTDGLDGLAIGPVLISAGTFMVLAYLAGHVKIASYLQIPYVSGSGELAVFCGAMVGASMGFLWYNTYPAQVFMGDTGSVALGAALGTAAVITKQEILLAVVGGLFVLETLSVIFQVVSFKLWRKRIFRMAPLHHHFELKGWAEPKVIVRFWIITIFLALVALSTLKLR
ncbi:MAG: phospho-N-acetylmuramoyl-pentapeptide-transferase [Deltaproteobacteria bacterium RBG_19FT_COMBO_52_11]|nr:MAG: phospho-N-acetylmuramoyl-pentapeptide-transferase [Deltaproteobacteria bacterium RBG_19FT_COMBO_52_11]